MAVDRVILGIHPLEDSSVPIDTARVNSVLGNDQKPLPILSEEVGSAVIISISDQIRIDAADVRGELGDALKRALGEGRVYHRDSSDHFNSSAWLDGLIDFLHRHQFNLTSAQEVNFISTGYRELFIALRLAGIEVRHSIAAITEEDVQKYAQAQ